MSRLAVLRKTNPTVSVPSLGDVSPEYARLVAKRHELESRRQALEDEYARLLTEMIPFAQRERESRIAALLSDDGASSTSEIPRPHDRLAVVSREIDDIKRALAVLTDQIGQARYRASEKIVSDIRPEYGRRVEAICSALLVLREASAAYVALTDELAAKDISWLTLEPLPVSFVGAPNDPTGRTANYLRAASRAGYFSAEKIPPELRN